METGFVKADSGNLPKVNAIMVYKFYCENPNFISAEIRNIKTERSTKESYGDQAIGYVQLKRNDRLCTVKARITPEHRIHAKGYTVIVNIDEEQETVMSCECQDCAASAGGCKHGVAMLMWLHRRSEEPSVTEVECYWKSSKLSKIGKTIKGTKIKDLFSKPLPELREKDGNFLSAVVQKGKEMGSTSILLRYFTEEDSIMKVSINTLILKYQTESETCTADGFLDYCTNNIHEEDCNTAEAKTRNQSKSSEWYDVRYGRITASKIYEVYRCKTDDGSLVEGIFGAAKIPQTAAMSRGLQLEQEVINIVQKKYNISIKKCGIFLSSKYPIYGASPDGLTEKYCIEIKCPQKNFNNYIDQYGKICKKPYAQLQLQMLLCNRKHGLFCVASPSFEETQEITILETTFDAEYCNDIVQMSADFWKRSIYPKLIN